MSTGTKIEWADRTWNPILGCERVSPGCDHCYAITQARIRAANPHPQVAAAFSGLTERTGSRIDWTGRVNLLPERLEQPLRVRKPQRWFVNSLADLFHDSVPDEFIARVFAVMGAARQHTFQVLTKRHARMRSLLSSEEFARTVITWEGAAMRAHDSRPRAIPAETWPLPNVWVGVSVEDQKWADIRIPALVATPAAVRFLSCEPLIGPVDLSAWMPPGFASWQCGGCRRFYAGPHQEICPGCGREGYWSGSHTGNDRPNGQPINWIIAGGESGPGARPMHPDWVRALRDQSVRAEVAFLFKQWGQWRPGGDPSRPADWFGDDGRPSSPGTGTAMVKVGKKAAGRTLDGWTWDEFPESSPTRAA